MSIPVNIPSRLASTTHFIEALVRSGVSYEQASYEGYRFAKVLLSPDNELSERMMAAAYLAEEAAKQAGIHSTQVMMALYKSSVCVGREKP